MKHSFSLSAIALVALSFSLAPAVLAHEPRYIKDDQPVVIKNPDVSQAFYGELKGEPAYYLINLKRTQDLYFQILVPDLPGIEKNKTVTVEYLPEFGAKPENFIKLSPDSAVWKNFYEEYAGDNYFKGPEEKKPGEAGYYIIRVDSPDDAGKYVLVVGEKEEFPAGEMAKALITIPQLKTQFFNKPVWQSFQGKLGKYFGLSLLILIVFGYMFRRFHRDFR